MQKIFTLRAQKRESGFLSWIRSRMKNKPEKDP